MNTLHLPISKPHSRHQARLAMSTTGLIGVIMGATIISYLIEQQLVSHYAVTLSCFSALTPCFIAGKLIQRSLYIPTIDANAIVFLSITIPFLILAVGLELLKVSFSLSSLILIYISSGIWYRHSYRLYVKTQAIRFLFIDELCLKRFLKISQLHELPHRKLITEFLLLDEHQVLPTDAIVWDPEAPQAKEHIRNLLQQIPNSPNIYTLEDAIEFYTARLSPEHISSQLLHTLHRSIYKNFKRSLDLIVSGGLLITLSPLLLTLALLIKLSSSGSVLFQQKRMGLGGKPFLIYKFRTMRPSQTKRMSGHEEDRITIVGRWMRRHRLDELPQLINVLKGDMALIGPRPEYVGYVRQFKQRLPSYEFRHLVRPGITGWAQVQQGHNSGLLGATIKLGYDLYYIKHHSPTLDLLIAFKTIRIILGGFGAQ